MAVAEIGPRIVQSYKAAMILKDRTDAGQGSVGTTKLTASRCSDIWRKMTKTSFLKLALTLVHLTPQQSTIGVRMALAGRLQIPTQPHSARPSWDAQ